MEPLLEMIEEAAYIATTYANEGDANEDIVRVFNLRSGSIFELYVACFVQYDGGVLHLFELCGSRHGFNS